MSRKHRCKGAGHVQRAEEVGLQLGSRRFDAAFVQEGAESGDAGVVDQQRDVAAVARRGGHVLGPRDIQTNRLDAGERDAGRVACRGVHLACTARQGVAGKGQPDAAVGAGDEDGGIGEFHRWVSPVGG